MLTRIRLVSRRLVLASSPAVYGDGGVQSLTNPYTGVVWLFARLARTGRPVEVYADGRIVRDLVFVEDVVGALASADR